jgi:hypothetical protein
MDCKKRLTVKEVMREFGYDNIECVYQVLAHTRKKHPDVSIPSGNGKSILIDPYLLPKTTKAERQHMEDIYWELEEKIGEIEICNRVAKVLNQSYVSVYLYFKAFTFVLRKNFNKYHKAILEVRNECVL